MGSSRVSGRLLRSLPAPAAGSEGRSSQPSAAGLHLSATARPGPRDGSTTDPNDPESDTTMTSFDDDRAHLLDQLHTRLDRFLGPLNTEPDHNTPVIARVRCRFGCRVALTLTPREWTSYRVADNPDPLTMLPTTPPEQRIFLTTGYCTSCLAAMTDDTPHDDNS